MEGTLTNGKKWASGTVSVTNNQNKTTSVPYSGDTQQSSSMPRMTVTGLKFKPSYVIILASQESGNTPAVDGYAGIMTPICNYYFRGTRAVTRYMYSDNSGTIGMTSNGFITVIPTNWGTGNIWWIAYE